MTVLNDMIFNLVIFGEGAFSYHELKENTCICEIARLDKKVDILCKKRALELNKARKGK